MRSKIDAEIDALFQLPLAEFTGARNALAALLKKDGRGDDAARVKALAKATATAWAVNQLYWRDRKDFERLLALSAKVRKAHTGASPDLRDLLEERRALVSELAGRAEAILREGGHAVTPDAMRRIAITLESLASWGHTEGAPQAGRLTTDLEPLGFDGLAALMGGAKLEPAKVLQFRIARERATNEKKSAEETAAARAQAKEAIKAAEKALTAAQRSAERAEAALEKATERAEAIERQKQEIDARYAEAKEAARVASAEAKKAAQTVTSAERTLERARAALED
jgi:hypothetical protein